jgi:hypothetical protein
MENKKIGRCKFKCFETGEYDILKDNIGYSATLYSIHGTSEEVNDSILLHGGNSSLSLSHLKEAMFKVGKEYYIDIISCEE